MNDDEFQYNVERFEFELYDYFRSNKITGVQLKNYPLTLPYSRLLVLVNDLVQKSIEDLMDYWQFLLQDLTEFQLVNQSCQRLLQTVKDTL